MKREILFLVLVLCVFFAAAAHAEQKPSVVHFVVITTDEAGVDFGREVPALEKEFCRLAGGYTAMGETSGGYLTGGRILREPGMSYMVSSKRNVASEIRSYVQEHFHTEPFILFWTAEQLDLN